MIGLIPTTCAFVFLTSLQIVGIDSIGAMLRRGLLGHITSFCALFMAPSMPGAGLASSAPSYRMSVTLMLAFFFDEVFLEV